MQLNFSEKEEHNRVLKEVNFNIPARTSKSTPHRTNICKVSCTGDNMFMVMSGDGIISTWSPSGELKRVKRDIVISLK
jgi:hypothetical protein